MCCTHSVGNGSEGFKRKQNFDKHDKYFKKFHFSLAVQADNVHIDIKKEFLILDLRKNKSYLV